MINDEADEIIEELFDSLKKQVYKLFRIDES